MNKIKIYPGFENEPEIISKSLQSRDVLRGTDLYANLGVGKSAGKKDIINKYRELSKSGAHPDKGGKAEE
jgi:preprotein translocase subunit Sec63